MGEMAEDGPVGAAPSEPAAASEAVCPGCHEAFALDAITGMLGDPDGGSDVKRRWHLRCHQDHFYEWINRDRRSSIDRAEDDLWKTRR